MLQHKGTQVNPVVCGFSVVVFSKEHSKMGMLGFWFVLASVWACEVHDHWGCPCSETLKWPFFLQGLVALCPSSQDSFRVISDKCKIWTLNHWPVSFASVRSSNVRFLVQVAWECFDMFSDLQLCWMCFKPIWQQVASRAIELMSGPNFGAFGWTCSVRWIRPEMNLRWLYFPLIPLLLFAEVAASCPYLRRHG